MDYKYSNKYFTDTGLIAKIGIGLLAVGIIFFIILAVAFHPFSAIFTAGWPIIIGVVLLIFGSAGNMKDSEYDEQAGKSSARILDKAMTKFEIEDRHIKIIEPLILKGYEFKNEEGFMFKKGNDGKYRSNSYVTSVLMFGPQQIYVYIYRISMTDEANPSTETMEKLRYLDLTGAFVENRKVSVKIRDKDSNVDFSVFEIKNLNGETIMSVPSSNDAILDRSIAEINKYIEKVKKQAQANA